MRRFIMKILINRPSQYFAKNSFSDDGYALILSMVVLLLLTILGLAASTTTRFELQISGNDRARRNAFYSAEAGRSFVESSGTLYDSTNIITESGNGVSFPNADDPTEWYPLPGMPTNQVQGKVVYVDSTTRYLRGSGNEAGELSAHVYKMTCNGQDTRSGAHKSIEAGFYRIGF